MDINQDKLLVLYKHSSKNGLPADPKAVADIVKHGRGNPIGIGRAYLQALKEKWPDEFGKGDPGNEELPDDDEPEKETPAAAEDDDDDGFGDLNDLDDEPEPAPTPEPVKEAPKSPLAKPPKAERIPTTVVGASEVTVAFLETPEGTVEKLEIVAIKDGAIVVRRPVPTDNVVLTLRGQQITVDLEYLKRQAAGVVIEGLPVSRLIELATAAKG